MELNEGNFQTLAQYLQQTLSSDANIRRPGIYEVMSMCDIFLF